MKHLSTFFVILLFLVQFSACVSVPRPKVDKNGDTIGTYYEYELTAPAEAYNIGDRLADVPAGSCVRVFGILPTASEYQFVEYNDYYVRLYRPQWKPYRIYKGKERTAFKPIKEFAAYTGRGGAGSSAEPGTSQYKDGYTPSTGATIYTGPRGGHYYYNSNGNKTYTRPSSSGGRRR